MTSQRLLVLRDVFNYGDEQGGTEHARVTVDDDRVIITPHDSEEKVILDFSREQWQEVVEFVRWVWSPPTVGGRD